MRRPSTPVPTTVPTRVARYAVALLVLLLGAVSLTACGGSSSSAGGTKAPKVIKVTFSGDSVTPNGERVDVSTGQTIRLEVTADQPGEIHVHSSPEQQLAYGKGTSTVTIKPIDAPGEVDVESHALDKVIVQLEVR
jgi:hypothetical protein